MCAKGVVLYSTAPVVYNCTGHPLYGSVHLVVYYFGFIAIAGHHSIVVLNYAPIIVFQNSTVIVCDQVIVCHDFGIFVVVCYYSLFGARTPPVHGYCTVVIDNRAQVDAERRIFSILIIIADQAVIGLDFASGLVY